MLGDANMDMGKDFVKKIGPLGMVMILLFSAVGTFMLFSADLGAPPRYDSRHTAEYYGQSAETMEELHEELRIYVFPSIEGILESSVLPDGRQILIRTSPEHYDRVKAAILRDFDEALFEFAS